jgi:hypothetical protein
MLHQEKSGNPGWQRKLPKWKKALLTMNKFHYGLLCEDDLSQFLTNKGWPGTSLFFLETFQGLPRNFQIFKASFF